MIGTSNVLYEWPSNSCAHTEVVLIQGALFSLSWSPMDANSSGRPGQPWQMCTVMTVKLGVTGQLNWNDTVR